MSDPGLWDVVTLDDEGNWKTLMSRVSYETADQEFERYADAHPNAYVDIVQHVF